MRTRRALPIAALVIVAVLVALVAGAPRHEGTPLDPASTGRLGTNRVFRLRPPPRRPGQMGRPVKHGAELPLAADAARPEPDAVTTTVTSRYGAAAALSWNRAHPKLKARGAWEGHQGALPVIEGTLRYVEVLLFRQGGSKNRIIKYDHR